MTTRNTNRKKKPSKTALDQQTPTKARDLEFVRTTVSQDMSSAPPGPGGKLGLIIHHVGAGTGATADELAEATGWQKHSVLGALSRLRSRGFAVRLTEVDGRKTYRLNQPED